MPTVSPLAAVVFVAALLFTATVAALVGLDRAGMDPALTGRRRVLTVLAYSSAFGVALCMGVLPAAA